MMKRSLLGAAVAAALAIPPPATAADNADMAEVKRMIEQMKADYEEKIEALEQRLKAAEQKAETAADTDEAAAKKAQSVPEKVEVKEEKSALDEAITELEAEEAQPAVATTQPSRDLWSRRIGGAEVRFLDISLNLMGAAGGSTANNSEIKLLQGGEHDPRRRGFTFQQAELSFAAAVDPYFRAETYIIASEEDVELEEAFFTTTSLPKSLELKGGYFLTEFGLINPTHPHNWDFIDQPVINTRMFGGEGQRAAGFRLNGLLPVAWFSELSFGAQDPTSSTMVSFQGSGHSHGDEEGEEHEEEEDEHEEEGVGGFARVRTDDSELNELVYLLRWVNGWDINRSTSAQLGLSGLYGSNTTGDDADTWIYGADFKLKWRPANSFRGWPYLIWQSEVMYRDYEVDKDNPSFVPGQTADLEDWGLYTQLVYGFIPRWETGLRFEFADGDDKGVTRSSTDPRRDQRYRVSPMLAWRPTEYSRIRLQYNYDDTDFLDDTHHTVWAGFDLSLGAHPAHKY